MSFFDAGEIKNVDFDALPPLIPKGVDHETRINEIVEAWCTPSPAGPMPGKDDSRSFIDWIDEHVVKSGFLLDKLDLWDGNNGEPVDLAELLKRVETRLRDEGEPEDFQTRPDLVIILRACRIPKCDASSVSVRPTFVAFASRFDENANFRSAQFGKNANFRSAQFGKNANFNSAKFGENANFSSARFGENAKFRSAQFGENANFYVAKFGENADFCDARFGENANFNSAKFGENADFFSAQFDENADFHSAKFGKNANFFSAQFDENADFRHAKFGENADFFSAQFDENADFRYSRFGENANLRSAQFGENADLRSAQFDENADFRYSRFGDGLQLNDARLNEADLRNTLGLILDETMVRNARFSTRAKDPWSQLRRTYTGPSMIFTLLFLTLFFTPYALRTAGWVGVHHSQERLVAVIDELQQQDVDDIPPISDQFLQDLTAVEAVLDVDDDQRWRETRVWRLVLGVDKGLMYWLTAVLLIVYNGIRAFLTFLVAPMRDEEERSGHSPKYRVDPWKKYRENDKETSTVRLFVRWLRTWTEAYGWLRRLHTVAQIIFYFAVAAFCWNAYQWLSYEIYMPVTQ